MDENEKFRLLAELSMAQQEIVELQARLDGSEQENHKRCRQLVEAREEIARLRNLFTRYGSDEMRKQLCLSDLAAAQEPTALNIGTEPGQFPGPGLVDVERSLKQAAEPMNPEHYDPPLGAYAAGAVDAIKQQGGCGILSLDGLHACIKELGHDDEHGWQDPLYATDGDPSPGD